MVSKEDVMHIADIAKLSFCDDEFDLFSEKFAQVIQFVDTIKEANTDHVEPLYQINNDTEALKDYDENEVLTREEVLQNTKEEQYGYFKILKVVE